MQPDIERAAALLEDALEMLALEHNLRLYTEEPDVELDLDGRFLDLRRPYNVIRAALLALQPTTARLLEVLDDPNAPCTALNFEASPAQALPNALQAAVAPQA